MVNESACSRLSNTVRLKASMKQKCALSRHCASRQEQIFLFALYCCIVPSNQLSILYRNWYLPLLQQARCPGPYYYVLCYVLRRRMHPQPFSSLLTYSLSLSSSFSTLFFPFFLCLLPQITYSELQKQQHPRNMTAETAKPICKIMSNRGLSLQCHP